MNTKKKRPAKVKPVVCWAEVGPDGQFTPYDLAPTKAGVLSGMSEDSPNRAVKVKIVPVN